MTYFNPFSPDQLLRRWILG